MFIAWLIEKRAIKTRGVCQTNIVNRDKTEKIRQIQKNLISILRQIGRYKLVIAQGLTYYFFFLSNDI